MITALLFAVAPATARAVGGPMPPVYPPADGLYLVRGSLSNYVPATTLANGSITIRVTSTGGSAGFAVGSTLGRRPRARSDHGRPHARALTTRRQAIAGEPLLWTSLGYALAWFDMPVSRAARSASKPGFRRLDAEAEGFRAQRHPAVVRDDTC